MGLSPVRKITPPHAAPRPRSGLAITALVAGCMLLLVPMTTAATADGSAPAPQSTARPPRVLASGSQGPLTVRGLGTGCTATLFSDDFENGLDGWSQEDVAGTQGKWWVERVSSPHSGSKVAAFNSTSAPAGSQTRLFRATGVALPGSAESVTLTFWMYHEGWIYPGNTVRAQVSTDGTTWTNVGPVTDEHDFLGWKKVTVDLTAYAGQPSLEIGLLGNSAHTPDDVFIDDVALTAQLPETDADAISGTITSGGAGFGGVTVTAGTASAVTASDGTYTITGLGNGTYTVAASRPGFWFQPASRSVTTACSAQTGVDFEANIGTAIDVTITADELDTAHGGSDADTGESLREAIMEANRNPSQKTWVLLDAKTYTLTRAGKSEDSNLTGDLDITLLGFVVVLGAGESRTVIDGNQLDRVFDVHPGGSLELRDLTIRNGQSDCGQSGGGISSAGTLTLLRVEVLSNATADCYGGGVSGGNGGGVYCHNGSLTVNDSLLNDNWTGNGGAGKNGSNGPSGWNCDGPTAGGPGGSGGDGGAIAADSCTVSIDGTTIDGNRTGNGGHGGRGGSSDASVGCEYSDGKDGGDGGSGGSGGGIWLRLGSATITGSRISQNSVGSGGDGAWGGTGQHNENDGHGGDGGDGGRGGGIANDGGVITVADSTFWGNDCVYSGCSGGRGVGSGANGGNVVGGGIYNTGSNQSVNLTVERAALYSNKASVGGGVYNYSAKMVLGNTTVAGGSAIHDNPHQSGNDSALDFCTISGNSGGTAAYNVVGSYGGPAMDNTIIAGNAGDEYVGPSSNFGAYNLIQVANPNLGHLTDNGGPTPTMALGDGSPAINAGDPTIPAGNPDPPTDQRSYSRVSGGRADIGAFEKRFPAKFVSVGLDRSGVPEGALEEVHGEIQDARLRSVTLLVDWGDGTTNTYHYSPTKDPAPFDEGHSYGNNPPGNPSWSYTITLTLTDDQLGGTDTRTLNVTVLNTAPSLTDLWVDSPTVAEGDTVTLHGQILDSVASEAFTVTVQWSIHESNTYSLLAGVSTFQVTHRYADNHLDGTPYAITASVVDDDGAPAPDESVTVMVTNVAPTLSNLRVTPSPVNEGSVATLKGTITDPGTEDTFTLQVDWGDGATGSYDLPAGTTSFSETHTYTDDDPTGTPQDDYPVSVTVTDKDGGVGTGSTTATVRNVAPVLSGLAATACDEGGTTTLSGTITDPSPTDTFRLQVDWGDGGTNTYNYGAGTTSFSVSHQVLDLVPAGKPTADNLIKLTVTDDDTGSSSARTTVHVTNVAPLVSNLRFVSDVISEGSTTDLRGDISDPGGAKDSYTLAVDWGDGTNDTTSLAVGATSFDVTHRYADDPPGPDDRYTASITLTDDDGGAATGSAVVTVQNMPPTPYPESYDGDEDVVLHVAAPGVLANDSDVRADTLHVVLSLSDTVSAHGARVTLAADGSFTYDPTARNCPLQGLAEGESVDDTFTYFVADDDMSPDTAGALGTTVTIHVEGHDESGAIYVDASASGANDGSSWANAFNELADALAVAWGGNTVDVAAGTYTPDVDLSVTPRVHTEDRAATFTVHRGVSVYGGFPPGGASFAERSPTAYPTVLSGEIGDPGTTADNTYQVVTIASPAGEAPMASPTVVDGFTISGAFSTDRTGGGMLVSNASPTIANCTFSGNTARYGGGLAAVSGGSPHVVNCVFQANQAANTSASGRGGAIYTEGASALIANSLFRGNTAIEYGGGLALTTGGVSAVTNCSFSGNSATLDGGAIAVLFSAQVQLGNSILWGDACGRPGCASGEIHDNGYHLTTVSYSDVQGCGGSGSAWWTDGSVPRFLVDGGGNVDADPRFTAAPADLHLRAVPAASPAIDAGNNSLVAADVADLDHDADRSEPTPADLDGLPRLVDVASKPDTGSGTPPIVDMGAYEVQANPVLSVTRAGTGSGTVTSLPAGIDCGGTCLATFSPGTGLTLTPSPAAESSFLGWVSSQPTTCFGVGACSITMPAAGSVWVGALFLLAPTEDLAVTNTDGIANVAPGASVTYTITVTNAGPADVTGATVADVFPLNLGTVSWTCVASAGASCTASGSGNIGDAVTIPANGSLTYTATGTLAPSAGEALVNTATVTPPVTSPDLDLTNNTATDTDTIGPEADLAIAVSDGSATVTPGAPLTYTILVSNAGPSDATGAQVTDTFPAALAGMSWTCSPSAGAVCTPGPVVGNIGDTVSIPSGGTLTYTATGTLDAAFSGTLVDNATVGAASGTHDGDLANNAASDVDSCAPSADLAITLDDGQSEAVPGMSTTYTIVASNLSGPSPVTGAVVEDRFPPTLTCSWTCAGSGGGSCTAGPVSGNLLDEVDLPIGAAVTYTATCQIAPYATGSLVDTADVGMASGGHDPNPANDGVTDTDTLRQLDFGDAPDVSLGPPWSFPVTLAENGARHGVVAGFHLGATLAAETDGTPSAAADADADDDGVSFASPLATCEDEQVTVVASAPGLVDAWVDFNANGSWNDDGEQIFTSQTVTAGANSLTFKVPCTATVTDRTFARFRYSSTGGLAPSGVAADGEVEDYQVAILGVDFGDAPDPRFPTLLGSDGARHALSTDLHLGASVDAEPSPVMTGDADDDGVAFTSPIVAGSTASVTVTASAPGLLDAWIDFTDDGSWNDPGDQIFASKPVGVGPTALSFAVPATARPGATTWARFRLSSSGGLAPTGLAADGEVEDYQVTMSGVADLGISVSDGLTTAVPGTSLTYTIQAANKGPSPASSAHVTDAFPTSLSCTWTCSASAGAACTSVGSGDIDDYLSLGPGATATYTATCTIAPTARGVLSDTATIDPQGLEDPSSADDTATDTDTLAAQGDLALAKSDGATTAVPGEDVTYTITATNSGPSQASGATLTDTFPGLERVSWTCVPSTGSSCSSAGSGALGETISVAPGGSVTLTARGSLPPSASGTLANTASVAPAADFADENGADDTATDTDTVTPEADLVVSESGPTKVVAGRDLTYTITVANPGPSDAPSVALVDPLPSGTTFVSQAQTSGPAFTLANTASQVTDTIATLAVGEVAEFTVVAHSDPGLGDGTVLTNTTTATTTATDPTPADGNNSAAVSTTVATILPPVADKTFSPASIPFLDGHSTLTVTVTNPADNFQTLTGIAFTDTLPAGLLVASSPNLATSCNGTASAPAGSNAVTLVNASLDPGGSCTVSVDVAVDPATATVGDLSNSVTVSSTNGGAGNLARATLTVTAVTSFSGETATGTGIATASFTGGGPTCTFSHAAWVGINTVPEPCPGGYAFPHGLLDFATTGCTPGAKLDFALTMPQPLDPDTHYWKYGATAGTTGPHWYELPSTTAGDTIGFSITDGQLGDDDLTANGSLSDQGGPAESGSETISIPALDPRALAILALLIAALGAALLAGSGRSG
jgi:uncharacterized repeat protein (TIGR01451 family)